MFATDPKIEYLTDHKYERSHIGTGNRCGHDPQNPAWHKYKQPFKKKELSISTRKMIEGMKTYFYNPHDVMPTLAELCGSVNQDGSKRKPRTDGCEAAVLIMQAILQYTDFASLRVGTPQANGDFINRNCDEIAQVSGLVTDLSTPDNIIPSQRFWRGWLKLKESGAFTVHKIYRIIADEFVIKADGSKAPKMRACSAIKAISADFLVATKLITYAQLNSLRGWSSEKLKAASDRFNRKNPEEADAKTALNKLKMRLTLGGSAKGVVAKINKAVSAGGIKPNRHTAELKRQYGQEMAAYAAMLSADNPDRPHSWVRERAREKYHSFDIWVAGKV